MVYYWPDTFLAVMVFDLVYLSMIAVHHWLVGVTSNLLLLPLRFAGN